MKITKYILPIFVFSFCLFAKESNYRTVSQLQSTTNVVVDPVEVDHSNTQMPQSREEIDLWVEDFEGETADQWQTGSGWQLTDSDSNSPTHSMNSPNDGTTTNGSWNLISPVISLPALGDGEVMNFGFHLNVDMPDSDGDNDNYLEDYYTVSLMDIDALAWHASSTDSYDGNSYWCGDEEVGGYLDSWIQFLDTPSFTVPSGGELTADMMWTIEDPAGAVVAGTCTDGWDAANVRISTDGGSTWDLLNGSDPYDFDCGYGWLWNSDEYNTGGSLNHLAAGWGGNADWHNVSFDLASYAGQEVIVRFAFGSDPAYCTLDDGSITGFHVDNIAVSGALDCTPENDCDYTASGAVWVDQFYDYWDDGSTYDPRPGSNGWEEYLPGYPFNGNVFLDISDFSEKDVIFRFQSRYDENDDGGTGAGLSIDDFRVYKISGGNYPAPTGLTAEAGDESASLAWNDMNASGNNVDFDFTNGDPTTGIQMSTSGSTAWAGERIDLAGASTVHSMSVHLGPNTAGVGTTIAIFDQLGSLYNNEPMWTQDVTLNSDGWNDFDVNLDMTNSYILAMQFTNVDDTPGGVYAPLDETAQSVNSMVLFSGGSWDLWSVAGASVAPGEWGIKANISFSGADVSYNVYQDGVMVQSGLTAPNAEVDGLTNNTDYVFAASATYSDGEESGLSSSVTVTPFAQTVHEEYHDDGSAESYYTAGSGNFTAVKYCASSNEDVVRFKWYQEGDGGAFYVKVYEDDGGMPGAEVYSQVVAGGLFAGWNDKDLISNGWTVSGDFWIGTKSFSSTQPFGLDDSGSGNSYGRTGSAGAWEAIDGNLMIRVLLDGDGCGAGPECTAGDVNDDGIINVLDIVAAVNFVLGASTPSDSEACASDYNGDGIINVLDIVAIVNVVLGG